VVVVVVAEGAVGFEHGIGDHERHVEFALGQLRQLKRGVQGIDASQPRVHILRGLVHVVIVISQRARRLPVGVFIVLDLADGGEVVSVTVELRQRRRAVQVGDRVERTRVSRPLVDRALRIRTSLLVP
jgi:hypothetical protein